jgi:hypothetical protein
LGNTQLDPHRRRIDVASLPQLFCSKIKLIRAFRAEMLFTVRHLRRATACDRQSLVPDRPGSGLEILTVSEVTEESLVFPIAN